MKSNQFSLFAIIACVFVYIATAVPMDTPSGSQPSPQWSTDTADQVPPVPEELFAHVYKMVHQALGKQLNTENAAKLTKACKHYREGFKDPVHSPDAYFGSEEDFVKDVAFCEWLKNNPDQKKIIKTIYVTSEVFMECQFNPTNYPQLRNVNIYLRDELLNFGHSGRYVNLLNDPGLTAMKNTKWDMTDPLILETFSPELRLFQLENDAIREGKIDWAEFLLRHRDWKSFKDAFQGWDVLLLNAIKIGNTNLIGLLYAIDEIFSIRQGRDPYALEQTIMMDHRNDYWFRGHVDEGFMNALIAVRTRNLFDIFEWLEGNPTPEQISRVLAAVITHFKSVEPFATDFEKVLAKDPRLDVKHRDNYGEPLICTSIFYKNWDAFDILLGIEGIEVNGLETTSLGVLHYALFKGMNFERFKRLLDKGADTFAKAKSYMTPLMTAFEEEKFQFAKAIIDRRMVTNAKGVVEIQLTAQEEERLQSFVEFGKMVGGYPIQIVQPH